MCCPAAVAYSCGCEPAWTFGGVESMSVGLSLNHRFLRDYSPSDGNVGNDMWQRFVQEFLTRKLLESATFHRVVRAFHGRVTDLPGLARDITQQRHVEEARRFGRIFLDELKQDFKKK
ncbi:uncharacterized protein V1510DRAFT_413313 [Dipodascopsis tothii]|uniref:uncharacterized protein n=1 Tax=Dipodascopsis tothii TaxID=44089 RepID=UPI0034CEECA9